MTSQPPTGLPDDAETSWVRESLADLNPLFGGFIIVCSLASAALIFRSGALFGIVVLMSAASLIAAMVWPWAPIGALLLAMPFMLVDVGGGIQIVHVLGAASAMGVIWAASLRRPGLRWSPILLGGVLMVAAYLAASLTSANPLASLKLGSIGFVGLALAVAIAQIAPDRHGLIWIMRCWLIGALASVGPSLLDDHSVTTEFGGSAVRGRSSSHWPCCGPRRPSSIGSWPSSRWW